jgi:hypothetical protein
MRDKPYLPEMKVRSLEGEKLVIPRDLEESRNLLAVAFLREQQADVDTWVPEFGRLEEADPKLVTYEVPVISRRFGPFRHRIDGAMTAAIPDPKTRAHTLTTYTDVGRVTRALGVDDTDRIVVVLADREGEIEWLHLGERTEQAAASLRSALGL